VTDERVLFKVIDGGVAVAAVLLGPVEVVEVVLDGVEDLLVLVHLVEHAQGVGDVDE
jgi:alpha-D-ribose 1-methylphosphonate 5-phosphate C-P lyase